MPEETQLPLLSGNGPGTFPSSRQCPLCGSEFIGGAAYLCGGAVIVDVKSGDSADSVECESYLSVGYHGSDPDVRDSVHAEIVGDLKQDQFAINFCSLRCLRKWFNELVDSLENDLARRTAPETSD